MKKFLAIILSVVILFSIEVPLTAFADDELLNSLNAGMSSTTTTTKKTTTTTTTTKKTTTTTTKPSTSKTTTTTTTTKPSTTKPSTTKPSTTQPTTKPTTQPTTQKKVSITLSDTNLSLTVNQVKTLRKTISPSSKDVTGKFYSKNEAVASVNKKGVITAKKKGETYIYYKASTGDYARCKVKVNVTSLPLVLNKTSIKTIYDKKTRKGIDVRVSHKKNNKKFFKITYDTSDKKIATVSSTGVVTPKKAGTVKIKVHADGKTATCTIKIIDTKDTNLTLNELANRAAITKDSCTRYVYGTSVKGRQLESYIIKGKDSQSSKILFMDFACHGFEDSYYRDGKVLTKHANEVVKYYASNPNKLGKYTLVVVPCVNPDGTIAGNNNQRACSTAFGRCTAAHVDMNRDFSAFRAVESRALRSLFSKYNPDIYLNYHGWLNTSIGTSWLAYLSTSKYGLNRVQPDSYGTGYIATYVRNRYGASVCLVEFASPSSAGNAVGRTKKFVKAIVNR